MKWLVELEDGERLEVEYVDLPLGTLTVSLKENEIALKRHDSIYFTGKLIFKTVEDKKKFMESGCYVIMPIRGTKMTEVVEV